MLETLFSVVVRRYLLTSLCGTVPGRGSFDVREGLLWTFEDQVGAVEGCVGRVTVTRCFSCVSYKTVSRRLSCEGYKVTKLRAWSPCQVVGAERVTPRYLVKGEIKT